METTKSSAEKEQFQVRKLEISDKNKGFIELLQQLTVCDSISDEAFEERFHEIVRYGDDQLICVIEDNDSGKIVATGSLFIEKKFIRSCGKVGHIEDVVVDSSVRGKQLGKKIIGFLSDQARAMGCYKAILDCGVENKPFYDKCGFEQNGVQMPSDTPAASAHPDSFPHLAGSASLHALWLRSGIAGQHCGVVGSIVSGVAAPPPADVGCRWSFREVRLLDHRRSSLRLSTSDMIGTAAPALAGGTVGTPKYMQKNIQSPFVREDMYWFLVGGIEVAVSSFHIALRADVSKVEFCMTLKMIHRIAFEMVGLEALILQDNVSQDSEELD
ncbi:hypothetical protein BUALT_Bualt09G0093100 [Buddleja alternifolia]|uniref:Glucosamine 6-phosphate N-acetyltransferase n=1 Tax=Buddleja alternifolia TaxID=168488 RepID=A0AAV6X2V6_9LAMI|nr:hypothetical protein BUALT_Bualt09G0093100 [Buddleja alternifolia]